MLSIISAGRCLKHRFGIYPSAMTDIAGTDLVDEISTYQDRILKVMMNGTIMDKIYRTSVRQVLISSKTI